MLTATLDRAQLLGPLRHLASQYIGQRRTAGELRARLVAIEHERARAIEAAAGHELADIERARIALMKSTTATTARLKAIETIIAAVARETVSTLGWTAPQA